MFWGDGYNPPAASDPRDIVRTPEQMIDLYRVITMNHLDVKTDRACTRRRRAKHYDNLEKAIGPVPL